MKLESLENKRLTNLNNVLGGTNGVTDGTNLNLGQWKTMHGSGNCNGSGGTYTCDSFTLDM